LIQKIASAIGSGLIFCLLFVHSAFSPAPLTNALLWKIEGPALEQASYLFGTIHALCPDDFDLPKSVKEKLAASQQLVMEINLAEINLSAMNPSLMTMNANQTLKELLEAPVYEQLRDYLKNGSGIDISFYDRLKPIFLSSVLLPMLLECPPQSVENMLLKEAMSLNIRMSGLETLSHQLEILSDVPLDLQVQYLKETMADLPKAKQELRQLIDFYSEESINRLYDLIRESEFQTYEATLLSNRNKDWIPKMEAAMDSSAVFFAVGAGHLAGERGVIRLLQEAGYTLSPLPLHQ
jgi:uncharacterized protein YbaP (TraB family)